MTQSAIRRPAIAFAMQPSRTQHVLPEALVQRLGGIGRALDAAPMPRFDDDRA
ncbi:MAG: hydroxyacid dehydrogenase, partial [Cupriavidus sp.]